MPVRLSLKRSSLALGVCLLGLAGTAPPAAALRAGVGRSDVTPPTGFYTMGYVRSDAIARGQHTRLFARSIVLEQGGRKLALVATDLGFTPGGLLQDVAARVAQRGFDERSIVISASHTHSGPAGYANYGSDNFVAPTQGTPSSFSVATDPRLYGFLVDRITLAILRADDDVGRARAAWGSSQLLGITQNRSLEAHLANFGFDLPYGTGRVDQDPRGYPGTIDPNVDVLRVDRVRRGRLIPAGAWMDFANHGTIDPYTFGVYSGDHQGHAARVFEAAVRRAGHVPRRAEVVGAYGNSDAGDMSAGLERRGPGWSDVVGRAEARAMMRAWRRAGRRLAAKPALEVRWTRICFCGQETEGGAVAQDPSVGFPFLTGSEENRGPLYDETHVNHEGDRLPADMGAQGRKIQAIGPPEAKFPTAVPLTTIRLGDRLLASVPGEMSVEMGRRTRDAVLEAARPLGVRQVVLAGYANEYVHYFVTPEEYEQQHYEGGSTLYGRFSSNLIRDGLTDLAARMAAGQPAPEPYPFDARNGVTPDETPYEKGAAKGGVVAQPKAAARLTRVTFAWRGGPRGFDRPLDRRFVTVQRRVGRRWRRVADDLGLELLWRVDDDGRYDVWWQIPLSARRGRYRFVVTANRYRLVSRRFAVRPSRALRARLAGVKGDRAIVALDYPRVDDADDLVSHRASAAGGRVVARVAGRRVKAAARRRTRFALRLPDARPVSLRIARGAARDRFGNRTGAGLSVTVR